MKRLLLAVLVLLLAAPVHAANLATPTATAAAATPAATASPDGAQARAQQAVQAGGLVFEKPNTFEGGAQIGKTADGATLVTFMARYKCTFDLPAFTAVPTPVVGPPRMQKLNCAATGAVVGDGVFASLQRWGEGEYVGMTLDTATVIAADLIELQFTHGSLAGLDPGPLTVELLVVR
jgi:hypothetical protein